MKRQPRIAVLGGGIMGCSVALFLARRGAQVTLFDAADRPFTAASRWNEGKIHLGYLYCADSSLGTAQHVLSGGLNFRPLVEELLDVSLTSVITQEDDIYLCHRESVVSTDVMANYVRLVTRLVKEHPDAKRYLADVSNCETYKLTVTELGALTSSPDIVAGFRVPERSVETTWLADHFVAAVLADKHIEQAMNTKVTAVRPLAGNYDGPWQIESFGRAFAPYDYIINALWQGRMAIDVTVGLPAVGNWSNRYRQALFLRTKEAIKAPCAVIATGPFGDIKNYNGRDFYLSWYPSGLLAESIAISPPSVGDLVLPNPRELTNSIFGHLETFFPWVEHIHEKSERVVIGGGWVFAAGRGLLSDPYSTLHRRSDFGITRLGSYVSVDTGKYSTAPWLAHALANDLF